MDYLQSWLNKLGVLKSLGRFDFVLVAILNARRYSNEAH